MVLIFCHRSYFFRLQSPNQALVWIFTIDFLRWAIFSAIHNHLGFTLSCLTHTEQVNQIIIEFRHDNFVPLCHFGRAGDKLIPLLVAAASF